MLTALYLEFFFDLCQLLHFLAELEGGHDRVGAGQRHVGGAGEGAVCVEPRSRPLQRVVILHTSSTRLQAGPKK